MKRLPIHDSVLFKPVTLGALGLAHRVVMPATSPQATVRDSVPSAGFTAFYRERATFGGLLVVAASVEASQALRSRPAPGIHSSAQVNGWREVITAVHGKGGIAAVQFSTPIGAATQDSDVERTLRSLRRAAENADDAGFDALELDVGSALDADDRLRDSSEARLSAQVSLEERRGLLLEMLETLSGIYGAERLGVWFRSTDGAGLASTLSVLSRQRVAYAHIPMSTAAEALLAAQTHVTGMAAEERPVNLIVRGARLDLLPIAALHSGALAGLSHGAAFVANPDLPARLLQGLPVRSCDAERSYD